jgi:4-amino-4-deoxy-L-arabinose transferase-like glycosyltransferase
VTPAGRPSRWVRAAAAAAVLVVAAALRLPRLGWGLPERFFPDEATLFRLGQRVAATGDLHTGFVSYPPLTTYALAAVYATLGAVRGGGAAQLPVADLVWWGRALMAGSSLATVAATMALGRAVAGPAAGRLAGLFLAVTPLHVTQSHVVCTDVPLTLLVVLALLAAAHRRAVWSGALAGLAAGAKYPGGLVALAPAWCGLRAAAAGAWRGDRRRALAGAGTLLLAAAAALAAFTLAFPHWLADLEAIRARAAWERFANREVGNPVARLAPAGIRGTPVLYQLAVLLPAALGIPLYLLALGGVVDGARRRHPHAATLLAFALPYFLFFATSRSVFQRYYLPLVPLLAVAAAGAAVRLGRGGARRRAAGVALAVVAAGHGLALSASLVRHTGLRPQQALRQALERRLAERRAPTPPRVAVTRDRVADYSGAAWALRGLPLEPAALRLERAWLRRERPELLVVAEIDEVVVRRNLPGSEAAATLADLAAGRLPYRLLDEVSVTYLHRGLYARLDPYFGVSTERGAVGFRVYGLAEDGR